MSPGVHLDQTAGAESLSAHEWEARLPVTRATTLQGALPSGAAGSAPTWFLPFGAACARIQAAPAGPGEAFSSRCWLGMTPPGGHAACCGR